MPGGVAEEGIPERGETGTALQRASSPQGPEENYGQDFEVDEETGVPDGPHIVALGNSSHQISHHISTRQAHHARMNQARNAFTEQALYSNSLPEMAFMRLPYSNQNPELITSSVDECVESAVLRCLDCNFGERKLLCSTRTHDREAHPFAHFHRRQRFCHGFWEYLPQETVLDTNGSIDNNFLVGGNIACL